jgi:orotate phosphoribosyltransferase
MDSNEILQLLEKVGAVKRGGHFVYTSGKHGSAYVNKDVLYTDPKVTSTICHEMSMVITSYCRPARISKVAVVAPAVGGVALSQWTTFHLKELGYDAVALYAEREEVAIVSSDLNRLSIGMIAALPELQPHVQTDVGAITPIVLDRGESLVVKKRSFALKRGYDRQLADRAVIVVEDILTTGGSVRDTVSAVTRAGGSVAMVAALCNRGNVAASAVGVDYLHALVCVDLEAFASEACPLCASGVAVDTSVGHGAAFVAKRYAQVT